MKTASLRKPAMNNMAMPAGASPEALRAKIALAAYYLAERRGFTPGSDLEDWLAAEAEITEKVEG